MDEYKNTWAYKKFIDSINEMPVYFGVDWAKDSGLNRGDIMSQTDNVIYVRFKTVDFLK